MIDLTMLGGAAGASALVSPIVTRYLKVFVPKKKNRALISPLVGFGLLALFGIASGQPVDQSLMIGLAGLAGGATGSSLRDSVKLKD